MTRFRLLTTYPWGCIIGPFLIAIIFWAAVIHFLTGVF